MFFSTFIILFFYFEITGSFGFYPSIKCEPFVFKLAICLFIYCILQVCVFFFLSATLIYIYLLHYFIDIIYHFHYYYNEIS